MRSNIAHILPPRVPIAIIRLDDLSHALDISRALQTGGITKLEFTLTNPRAFHAIEQVREAFENDLVIGAGTVLNREDATTAIEVGAQFLVTPALVPEVIEEGRRAAIPVMCGAFTPTEILSAWTLGVDLVKVFPAGQLGASYIKDVLAPLPDIALVPTGGVNLTNCADFLRAGAYTVAIGSQLVAKDIVRRGDWKALEDLARRFVQACA